MFTAESSRDQVDAAATNDNWDDETSLQTYELEVKIPYWVRLQRDKKGKRLVDHFPTYHSLASFTLARYECGDAELKRLSHTFFSAILEVRKEIASYEVEMSYWRYYFGRDSNEFASAEDTKNKERLYQLLTSDDNCEPGDTAYMNVHF